MRPEVAVDPLDQLLCWYIKDMEVRGHWLWVRIEVELGVPAIRDLWTS